MLLNDPKEALTTVLKNAAPRAIVWEEIKLSCFNLLGTIQRNRLLVAADISQILSTLELSKIVTSRRTSANNDYEYYWTDINWKDAKNAPLVISVKPDQPCRVCRRNCTPGDKKCWWCENEKPC